MFRGLIRVLTEEETECCENTVGTLFTNAIADNIAEWDDVIIYTSRSDKNDEINGVDAETYYESLRGGLISDKCEFLNTINLILDNDVLNNDAETRIKEIELEICPTLAPEILAGETQTCTDPAEPGEHNKAWYRFDYNGSLSSQVRYDYYYMVLDKLGIGMFGPGQEGKCVEKMKVWESSPDRYTQDGVDRGPTIEWWDGFRINCDCIPDNSPYKEVNLNIYDLDHPNIKVTGVPTEIKSNIKPSNTNNNNTRVNNDNNNQDDGLINVINNDGKTNPYKDISFL